MWLVKDDIVAPTVYVDIRTTSFTHCASHYRYCAGDDVTLPAYMLELQQLISHTRLPPRSLIITLSFMYVPFGRIVSFYLF